jgi:hypothetical protein
MISNYIKQSFRSLKYSPFIHTRNIPLTKVFPVIQPYTGLLIQKQIRHVLISNLLKH